MILKRSLYIRSSRIGRRAALFVRLLLKFIHQRGLFSERYFFPGNEVFQACCILYGGKVSPSVCALCSVTSQIFRLNLVDAPVLNKTTEASWILFHVRRNKDNSAKYG